MDKQSEAKKSRVKRAGLNKQPEHLCSLSFTHSWLYLVVGSLIQQIQPLNDNPAALPLVGACLVGG